MSGKATHCQVHLLAILREMSFIDTLPKSHFSLSVLIGAYLDVVPSYTLCGMGLIRMYILRKSTHPSWTDLN